MVQGWVRQVTNFMKPFSGVVNGYDFWHVLIVFGLILPIVAYLYLVIYRRCIANRKEMKQTNTGPFSSFNFSTNMWTGLSSVNMSEVSMKQEEGEGGGELEKQRSIRKPLKDFKSRPNLVPPTASSKKSKAPKAIKKKPSPPKPPREPSPPPPPPPSHARADSELLLESDTKRFRHHGMNDDLAREMEFYSSECFHEAYCKIIDLGITAEPPMIKAALEASNNEVNSALAYILQQQNYVAAPGTQPGAAPDPMSKYHSSPVAPSAPSFHPPSQYRAPKPAFQPGAPQFHNYSSASPKPKKYKSSGMSKSSSSQSSQQTRAHSNRSHQSGYHTSYSNQSAFQTRAQSNRSNQGGYQFHHTGIMHSDEIDLATHSLIVE